MIPIRNLATMAVRAAKSWSSDNVPRLGASLAYYTLFSIAPILLIAIAIGGRVFGAEAVRGQIVGELDGLVGRDGAAAIQTLLEGASKPGTGGVALIVGAVTLMLTATGAFLELQHALNTIFKVKADPSKAGIKAFIKNRLRSLGLVFSIGFLLLVSLVMSAILSAASTWVAGATGGSAALWDVLNFIVSGVVIIALFALIYRFLPDVRLKWRDVFAGASITGSLFLAGKALIGTYIGRGNWTTSYGTIGSVLVLLLWIYYSAQIVLYGAELTRQVAEQRGALPAPDEFARPDPAAHPGAAPAPRAPHLKRKPAHERARAHQ
jgi:membrane protein